MSNALLIAGLIFPAISWLSFIACAVQNARTGKSASGVYIPFIGPVLIDIWIYSAGHSAWFMLLPWVADIGTVLFVCAMPRLVGEFWQTSRYTQRRKFTGAQGNQTVTLTLHEGGNYVLVINWQREADEPGITQMSEPGTYEEHEGRIDLTSHSGRQRRLTQTAEGWQIQDTGEHDNASLDNWQLLEE